MFTKFVRICVTDGHTVQTYFFDAIRDDQDQIDKILARAAEDGWRSFADTKRNRFFGVAPKIVLKNERGEVRDYVAPVRLGRAHKVA